MASAVTLPIVGTVPTWVQPSHAPTTQTAPAQTATRIFRSNTVGLLAFHLLHVFLFYPPAATADVRASEYARERERWGKTAASVEAYIMTVCRPIRSFSAFPPIWNAWASV